MRKQALIAVIFILVLGFFLIPRNADASTKKVNVHAGNKNAYGGSNSRASVDNSIHVSFSRSGSHRGGVMLSRGNNKHRKVNHKKNTRRNVKKVVRKKKVVVQEPRITTPAHHIVVLPTPGHDIQNNNTLSNHVENLQEVIVK